VEFEITEPEIGQSNTKSTTAAGERTDTTNNSAITYLNVIDQQIRVLLLEGSLLGHDLSAAFLMRTTKSMSMR